MFNALIAQLQAKPRTIVFTEGPDPRILEAADRLLKDDILKVIMIGNVEEVKAAAAKGNFNIEKAEIIDPATYPEMEELVEQMVALRKGKMTEEQCRASLAKGNYFGTMLVKMGKADALLGGATYSTADTVRPALQLVKTKKGANLVSSCFVLVRGAELEEMMVFGDCGVNISYHDKTDKAGNVTQSAAAQLAEVAIITAETAKSFGLDPKVAMLSFSTKGSAKHEVVDKVTTALALAKELRPELKIDGELQADAALVPSVGESKAPGSAIAGHANVLVFPNLEVGNIAYKLVQRLGNAEALGPILQGIARPVNDLSRGCSDDDVYKMIAITACQAIAAKK